jgi:hypothetical protein
MLVRDGGAAARLAHLNKWLPFRNTLIITIPTIYRSIIRFDRNAFRFTASTGPNLRYCHKWLLLRGLFAWVLNRDLAGEMRQI